MTQAERTNTTTAISIADLNTQIDSEPRVQDIVLGERLGFARPRKVREIIERNLPELKAYGSSAPRRGAYRGTSFVEYHLNEPQALLICMFSNTAKAAEVRRQLITVFMEYRRSQEKPIKVQAHERRASTKLDNAISLARSAERLEAIAASLTPKERYLSATLVDGQPVVFDPHDTTYQRGDVVLGIGWSGNMIVERVDSVADQHASFKPGGNRLVYGQPYRKDGATHRDGFFAVGKVIAAQEQPHQPVTIGGRKGPYQDDIINLIGTGRSPTAIAREVGCSREAVRYWQRKIAA